MKIEINLTDQQLAEIVAKLNITKPKSKRWRAEKEQEYWYIDTDTSLDVSYAFECDDMQDDFNYSIGNYFQTEQQAETHLKHLQLLQKLKDEIAELNGDWACDWSEDTNQHKFYICYDHHNKQFFKDWYSYVQKTYSELQGTPDTIDTILSTWSKEDLYLALYGCEL